jgi:hypothetical protein
MRNHARLATDRVCPSKVRLTCEPLEHVLRPFASTMKIPNDLKAQCKDISLLLEAKADILSEKYFPNVVQPASRCPKAQISSLILASFIFQSGWQ